MKLTCVLSDTQFPFHDRRAFAAVCNLLADRTDIGELFQVGDFFDFTAISRWVKGTGAEDGRTLQKELDVAASAMADINAAYVGEKTRIKGNHDDRLDAYLSQHARGLKGLRALDYDTLTLAAEYGWTTVAEPYRLAPKTVAVHGLAVRSKSGHTAHAHLEKLPGNIVHGHTHRAGIVYRTLGSHTRWAMEVGCLMDRQQATYLGPSRAADWQTGIGFVWQDGQDSWPVYADVKTDHSLMFEGRRYRP